MVRHAWIVGFIMSFFLIYSQSAFSLDIKANSYDVYTGDINGDGLSDYYFSGKPLIIILHGDIATPIIIYPVNFVILRSGNSYSNAQVYNITAVDLAQKISTGVLKIASFNTDYFMWGNANNTQINILLRGADASAPSVILANFSGTLLPVVAQTYPPASTPNANLSNRALNVSIQDANNDGRMDIAVGLFFYLSDVSSVPGLIPISANQSGSLTTKFLYDDLGRLMQVQATNGAASNYHYDSQDNRTSNDTIKGVSP